MTETTFKFVDLSDTAKQKARETYRSNALDYEWWDGVYEDAVAVGKCLGVNIDRPTTNPQCASTSIYFTGFWSQGDGASFAGDYEFKADAVKAVTELCGANDAELIRIAAELTALQITRVLVDAVTMEGVIKVEGRYSHSGTMSFHMTDFEDEHELDGEHETAVEQLMRDFADWIYKRLEDEYCYLTSDEIINEQLQDDKFDEGGNLA